MDIGLIIGLVFMAICIIVNVTGVFKDDPPQQNNDQEKDAPKTYDDILRELMEIEQRINQLKATSETEKGSPIEINQVSETCVTIDTSKAIADALVKSALKNGATNETEARSIVFSVLVEKSIKQLLESCHIILTTKNVNVFLNRYDFIKEKALELNTAQQNPRYSQCVTKVVEQYKNLYPDRDITKEQMQCVNKPQIFLSDDVFGKFLYNCYQRYCDKMELEIASLKTEKAKERRREKIADTSRLMTPYITSYELTSYAHMIFTMINDRFGIEFSVSVKSE